MASAVNKWIKIRRHLTNPRTVTFYDYNLATIATSATANNKLYISKTIDKFRLKSHLDWAYYTPKTLAFAINNNDVDVYYQQQLKHQQSTPNIWKRWDEEMDLKSYYAVRAGRASLI